MSTRVEQWAETPAQFARQALAERLAVLLKQIDRTLDRTGVDEVHDLRVSIRRFSQALRIFAPLAGRKSSEAMRAALKKTMDAAAVVRDLDVGLERLRKMGLPGEHALLAEMREERRRGELALRGRLLLLKATEPERAWPEQLRRLETTSRTPAQAAGREVTR
jgi:CHAD domain-containing protein